MLAKVRKCVSLNRLLYSRHAREEMESEELGLIREQEVFEALTQGKIVENYPEDEPYPSCLIFGRTLQNRPLHVVCSYAEEDDTVIIITVYEPNAARWAGFERRLK